MKKSPLEIIKNSEDFCAEFLEVAVTKNVNRMNSYIVENGGRINKCLEMLDLIVDSFTSIQQEYPAEALEITQAASRLANTFRTNLETYRSSFAIDTDKTEYDTSVILDESTTQNAIETNAGTQEMFEDITKLSETVISSMTVANPKNIDFSKIKWMLNIKGEPPVFLKEDNGMTDAEVAKKVLSIMTSYKTDTVYQLYEVNLIPRTIVTTATII